MNHHVRSRLSLLVALCLLGACSAGETSATQIIVTVDSDLSVPTKLDRVTIEAADRASAPVASADLTSQKLPRSIGLVHDGGPLGPFSVRARGYLGAKRVIEREVMTSFVEGATVEIQIDLEPACLGLFCEAGRTCVAGTCVDIPTATGGMDSGVGNGVDGGGGEAGATSGSEGGAAGNDGGATGGTGDGGTTTGGASDGGTTGTGPGAGTRPDCTIALPDAADTYEWKSAFPVRGSCTDAESGTLTDGLTWTSNRDGQVGVGGDTSITLATAGTHILRFCGPDPEDSKVVDCDMVSIDVVEEAQPHVMIDSVKQSNSSTQPFSSAQAVDFAGSGSGAGVTLRWMDSIHGQLGTSPSVSLAQPEVGKHVVTLIGTDRSNDTGEDSATYTVLAPGASSLVAGYGSANGTLANNGGSADVSVLGLDPAGRVYAAANDRLYAFVGAQANPTAGVAVDAPPLSGAVLDVFVAAAQSLAYLGTTDGLAVCTYVSVTGIATTCTVYRNGTLPTDRIQSVLRMTSDGNPFTLIGTSEGLLVLKDEDGSNQADQVDNVGADIRAMIADGSNVWLASDAGLYRYDPKDDISRLWNTDDGAPTLDMTSLARGTGGNTLWIGSTSGLIRFVVGTPARWTSYGSSEGLSSNTVNAVAVASTVINGVARDVIWVATDAGVSRFDPTIPSFTTLTTADGLPSDTVHDIVVLADGTKVFATAAGVAHYDGP